MPVIVDIGSVIENSVSYSDGLRIQFSVKLELVLFRYFKKKKMTTRSIWKFRQNDLTFTRGI